MANLLYAVIFGIVEGVTEFLPISSTGHLMLTASLLKIPQTDFMKSFEIAIQLGAILSVVVLYWRQLFLDFKTIKRIAAAFVPTAVIGLVLYKVIKRFLLGNIQVVLWSLFIGGIFIVIFESLYRQKDEATGELSSITYGQAVFIGLFQSLAVVPGVSRAAATIIGGLVAGLKRKTIVEFSFLLAVPTMLAAVTLDLVKSAGAFNGSQCAFLAVGFLTSFAVAIIVIKSLLYFIKRYNFVIFGLYRIAVALLFWLVIKG